MRISNDRIIYEKQTAKALVGGQLKTNSCGESCLESRCECGQLVAKLKLKGVELKCKRCKRIVLIPFSSTTPEAGFLLPESHPDIHL